MYARKFFGEIAIAIACVAFVALLFFLEFLASPRVAGAPSDVRILENAAVRASNVTYSNVSAHVTPHAIDMVRQQGLDHLISAGPISIRGDEAAVIDGWAFDGDAKRSAGGVFLIVDGKRRFGALYGDPRPDVMKAFNVPLALACGFAVTIPADELSIGRHRFDLDVVDAAGDRVYRQPNVLTLDVRKSVR
jgi:hypothetical protein